MSSYLSPQRPSSLQSTSYAQSGPLLNETRHSTAFHARSFPPSLLTDARVSVLNASITGQNLGNQPSLTQRALVESPMRTIVANGSRGDQHQPTITTITTEAFHGGAVAQDLLHSTTEQSRSCPIARASVHFEPIVPLSEPCVNSERGDHTIGALPQLCIHQEVFAPADRCAVVSSLNFVLLQPTLRTFWRQLRIGIEACSAHVIPFMCKPPPALPQSTPSDSDASDVRSRFQASAVPVTPVLHLMMFQSHDALALAQLRNPGVVYPLTGVEKVKLVYSRGERGFVVSGSIDGQNERELVDALRRAGSGLPALQSTSRLTASSTNVGHWSPRREPRVKHLQQQPEELHRRAEQEASEADSSVFTIGGHTAGHDFHPHQSDAQAAPRRIGQKLQQRFAASASFFREDRQHEEESKYNSTIVDPLTVSFLDHAALGHVNGNTHNAWIDPTVARSQAQAQDRKVDRILAHLSSPAKIRAHRDALEEKRDATGGYDSFAASMPPPVFALSVSVGRFLSATAEEGTTSAASNGTSSSSKPFCALLPLTHQFDGPQPPAPVDARVCIPSLAALERLDGPVLCAHQVVYLALSRLVIVKPSQWYFSHASKSLLAREGLSESGAREGWWMWAQPKQMDSATGSLFGCLVHVLSFGSAADAPSFPSLDVALLMFPSAEAQRRCVEQCPEHVVAVPHPATATKHPERYVDLLYSRKDGTFILPPRLLHALLSRGGGSATPAPSSDPISLLHILVRESTSTPIPFSPHITSTTASERVRLGLHPTIAQKVTVTGKLEDDERLQQSVRRLQRDNEQQLDALFAASQGMVQPDRQGWIRSVPGVERAEASFSASTSARRLPLSSSTLLLSPHRASRASGMLDPARESALRFHQNAYPALIVELPRSVDSQRKLFYPEIPLDYILSSNGLKFPSHSEDPAQKETLLQALQGDASTFLTQLHGKPWWVGLIGSTVGKTRKFVESWMHRVNEAYQHRIGKALGFSVIRLDSHGSFAITFLRCGRIQHARVIYDLEHGSYRMGEKGRWRIVACMARPTGDTGFNIPTIAPSIRGSTREEDSNSDYISLSDVTYASLEDIFPKSASVGSFDEDNGSELPDCPFPFPPLLGTTFSKLTEQQLAAMEIHVDPSGHGVRLCREKDDEFPFAPLSSPLEMPVAHDADPLRNTHARAEDEYYEEYVAKVLHHANGQEQSPRAHWRSVRGLEERQRKDAAATAAEQDRHHASSSTTTSPARKPSQRLDFSPPHRQSFSHRTRIADSERSSQSNSNKGGFKARSFSETLSPPVKEKSASVIKSSVLSSSMRSPSTSSSPTKHVRIAEPEIQLQSHQQQQSSPPTFQPASASSSAASLGPSSKVTPAGTITNLTPSTVSQLLRPHLIQNVHLDTTNEALESLRKFLNELVWQALPIRERRVLTRESGVATVRERIEQLVRQAMDAHIQVVREEGEHMQLDAHKSLAQHAAAHLSPTRISGRSSNSGQLIPQAPLTQQALQAAHARLAPSQVQSVAACFGGSTALAFEHLIGRTYFACTRNHQRVEDWLRKQAKDATIVRMGSQEGTLALSFIISGDVQHIRLRYDVVSNYFHLLGHHATHDAHGAPITVDLSMHYWATIPEIIASNAVYQFPPLWVPHQHQEPKPHVPTLEELQQIRPLMLRASQ